VERRGIWDDMAAFSRPMNLASNGTFRAYAYSQRVCFIWSSRRRPLKVGWPDNLNKALAVDPSVSMTMKNAAKRDSYCELQNSVNHRMFERSRRPRVTPVVVPL